MTDMVVTPSSRIGNFERAAQLAAAIADAGTCFIADVETLRATAFELARLDAELRACETALSRPRGPSAVELAVQVLLGRLAILRPELPFASAESADAAAAVLSGSQTRARAAS